MPQSLSFFQMGALVIIALIAGIGITAIGPGGVLLTIALFILTDLSPAGVAGTAIVTHIATGIAGTLAYVRSGQLRHLPTRRLATTLAISTVIGAPIGVFVNSRISTEQFGILLAIFVMAMGSLVLLREFRGMPAGTKADRPAPGRAMQVISGFGIALVSVVFGLGGPMIAVPVLVIAGIPMLAALAAAQAQSVVLSITGAGGYLSQGAIDWPLALLTGIPEVIGVWLGWRIAHAVPRRPLTIILGCALIVLGPIVAF